MIFSLCNGHCEEMFYVIGMRGKPWHYVVLGKQSNFMQSCNSLILQLHHLCSQWSSVVLMFRDAFQEKRCLTRWGFTHLLLQVQIYLCFTRGLDLPGDQPRCRFPYILYQMQIYQWYSKYAITYVLPKVYNPDSKNAGRKYKL